MNTNRNYLNAKHVKGIVEPLLRVVQYEIECLTPEF